MYQQYTSPRTCHMGPFIPWTTTTLILCWWRKIQTNPGPQVKWEWSCSNTFLFSAQAMEVNTSVKKNMAKQIRNNNILYELVKVPQTHKNSESDQVWLCFKGAGSFEIPVLCLLVHGEPRILKVGLISCCWFCCFWLFKNMICGLFCTIELFRHYSLTHITVLLSVLHTWCLLTETANKLFSDSG